MHYAESATTPFAGSQSLAIDVSATEGGPALRLTGFNSEWGTTVRLTVPFQARPLHWHTFSLWMKGSAGHFRQMVLGARFQRWKMDSVRVPHRQASGFTGRTGNFPQSRAKIQIKGAGG